LVFMTYKKLSLYIELELFPSNLEKKVRFKINLFFFFKTNGFEHLSFTSGYKYSP